MSVKLSSDEWLETPIKGILLDINGVLKNSYTPECGALMAFKMLQNRQMPYRLLINETTKPKSEVARILRKLGFNVKEKDIITPIPVMVDILQRRFQRPFLLVHKQVMHEFKAIRQSDINCVVVGDAGNNFSYTNLNYAAKLLLEMPEPVLFSMGARKYYKGYLCAGAFTKSLEFVTGTRAEIIGKPNPEYYLYAVNDMGLEPKDVVMISEDLECDVRGAQSCGIRGILVRTLKYRGLDTASLTADGCVRNFYEAMMLINFAAHKWKN